MYVSNYPWNLMLGDVEFRVIRKLLSNETLTDEEETRADQMADTLNLIYAKKMDDQKRPPTKIIHSKHHCAPRHREHYPDEARIDAQTIS